MHPHICLHCRLIVITPPPNPGPRGFRYRLPHTKLEAFAASISGCPLFKFLISGYRFATSPQQARLFAQALLGKPDYRLPRAGAFTERERIVYLAETLSKRPFQIRFAEDGMALFTVMGWGSFWFSVTAWPGKIRQSLDAVIDADVCR